MFHLNCNEVKQCSESSQGFYFNSSELEQGTKRRQRFHFNSTEVKWDSSVIREFILIIVTL